MKMNMKMRKSRGKRMIKKTRQGGKSRESVKENKGR